MNLVVLAIVLAIICAVIEHFFGIADPWRKIIWVGIIIIFVVGLVLLLVPGLFPLRV